MQPHVSPQDAREKQGGPIVADAGSGRMEVWRVGGFKKHPIPEEMHGVFYAGDR